MTQDLLDPKATVIWFILTRGALPRKPEKTDNSEESDD